MLPALKPNLKYWIGLQRSGNDWQWIESSASTYRNWASSATPTTGCVIANAVGTAAGTWSTTVCSQRFAGNQGVICKMVAQNTTAAPSSTAIPGGCMLLFTLRQLSKTGADYETFQPIALIEQPTV